MGFTAPVVVLQPPAIMIRRDDDRHPVMQRRNGRVRRTCNDGERISRLAWWCFIQVGVKLAGGRRLDPPVPQTGKAKRLTAFQHYPERLPLPVHFLPLEKTVRRN